MAFRNRSFTDIHSLTREEIEFILDKTAIIKAALLKKDRSIYRLADGMDLMAASLFYENSTRTRSSFEIAAKKLGVEVTGFSGIEGTSVKKGESLQHTLDMFRAYLCDAVIMRHPLDGAARFAADYLDIPIFNGGDGKNEHPTQTLLDLFTIREHLGRLDGIDIGMGGDLKYGRTVHSLAIALSKFSNVRLHFFSHPLLKMPQGVLDFLQQNNVDYVEHDSLYGTLGASDIFYQTRVQRERMPDDEEYQKAKDACRITAAHLSAAKETFGLMHPLPINKEYPEVTPDADASPKTIYRQQAGNGLPLRLVLLALSFGLMGTEFRGKSNGVEQRSPSFYTDLLVVKKEQKTEQNLKPIQGSGTVIDHLVPGTARKLMDLLKVEERCDIYRGGTVRRRSNRDELKAMLMIENRRLTDDELRMVAAISPKSRINTITNGEVSRKIELHMPDIIEGIPYLMCTNTGCITRPEHHEHVTAKFIRAGESLLRCYYCNAMMGARELF
ncbi:aspartate carbamoyltransferase [Candidatus Woesearchaeota archaeon]|nr:aspartate carbamoyltransferase [Candidatus Woesearchaeota archaeon]